MENNCSDEMVDKLTYKVLLLGDTRVGKTCLINRYINDKYNENLQPTVSFQNCNAPAIQHGNKEIILNIWDTAGQEKYDSITTITFRDAKAVLLTFALDNLATLETLEKWEIRVSEILGDAVFFCVVGTKCDLVNDEIAQQAMQRARNKFPDIQVFYTTSSREKIGVNEMFTEVAINLATEYPTQKPVQELKESDSKCC